MKGLKSSKCPAEEFKLFVWHALSFSITLVNMNILVKKERPKQLTGHKYEANVKICDRHKTAEQKWIIASSIW